VLLLKFLTNRFKSIGSTFNKEDKNSVTSSTVFLAVTELFMVVLGILLALYIDRWNSTKSFEKQFESTLRIVQQNLESDINNSDNVIAHFHSRDSLRHDVMMNKFNREYYEKGISYWQQVIVYYDQFQITDDGYNLLLEMKDEVPEKYAEVFLKVKDLYKTIPTIDEFNKNFKEVIWGIHNELTYSHWFWLDNYYGEPSKEQIDFYFTPYYKALVQKVLNASNLIETMARQHRIKAIDLYNEINYLLGQEKEIPKNVTYILNDSISKNYIGKYKLIEGNIGTWFPKYLVKDSVLDIGFKDSILYVMKNEKYAKKLYFFNRLNSRSSNYPIKKNHVFVSSQGYYEFYKNGKLKIGAAGPETIWQRQ
jgi:hypothetical protein